ncbi:putative rna ligase 2 protein [Botrytis fragariae]|uniref:Putative rna ligase 2 protein n=1 Tax=Botrytis fragariae TaxID=1964551 RepID=A0A8H6AKW5_9HELO|nr:putative rna ligase 2 protein [Botrytis fragariae]KAF5869588.1 putative rna ligase 2 protein [Botrytis fragariae]
MASKKDTLYPKISGKPKNLLVEFSKYQRTSKARRTGSISVTGTVKLHGTHGDIRITAEDTIYIQTRNSDVLTPALDSLKFLDFIQPARAEILALKKQFHARFQKLNPKVKINDEHPLIIAGEWIGPKIQKDVAVSALPERYFVIISVSINNEWQPDEPYSDIENESINIVNISRGGFYHETIELKNPDPAFAKMQALADEVEKECPFAKTFGLIGLGEGIVWKPAAPLCYDAKYWLKLKGPVSMGIIEAGPAAHMPQRSSFIAPVFAAPAPSPAARKSAILDRKISNAPSPRNVVGTPMFSASPSSVAASRASNKPMGNPLPLEGSRLKEFPSLPVSPSATTSKTLKQTVNTTMPLEGSVLRESSMVSAPIPMRIKKTAGESSGDSRVDKNIISSPLLPRQVCDVLSEFQCSRSWSLVAGKTEERESQSLGPVRNVTRMPIASKNVTSISPENARLLETLKSAPVTPEMFQQARSEIMSLFQMNSSAKLPIVSEKEVEHTPEVSKSDECVISSPVAPEETASESSDEGNQEEGGWPMPSSRKKSHKEQSEHVDLVPLIAFTGEVGAIESEHAQLSPVPSKVGDDNEGSSETTMPACAPLILNKIEGPEVIAARNFANEVIWERRLEQGWQYLIEKGERTERQNAEKFLNWLWEDVAVEEEVEIEELELNVALLKKEIFSIGRDWYFEHLAFEEQNENWGVGAAR